MPKSELLMLAHVYKPVKHQIAGWYISEKLDGMRCFWDGGVTRGIPKSLVPWANTAKDARLINEPIATGLWTRYGGVVYAPNWFLDSLPSFCLDGELFTGRSDRQNLMSTIKVFEPDNSKWEKVKYWVFDCPHPEIVFDTREINTTNYKKLISLDECMKLYKDYNHPFKVDSQFNAKVKLLDSKLLDYSCSFLRQEKLSHKSEEADEQLINLLDDITSNKGEGVMLRHPFSCWEPHRSHQLLKAKHYQDAEGTVTGYTTGRETDKGSKLLGLMGALIIEFKGKRLELSGFTDQERELSDPNWAEKNTGVEVPEHIFNPHFPRGTTVTFRYRDLSKDGIPQEARYWRRYDGD